MRHCCDEPLSKQHCLAVVNMEEAEAIHDLFIEYLYEPLHDTPFHDLLANNVEK